MPSQSACNLALGMPHRLVRGWRSVWSLRTLTGLPSAPLLASVSPFSSTAGASSLKNEVDAELEALFGSAAAAPPDSGAPTIDTAAAQTQQLAREQAKLAAEDGRVAEHATSTAPIVQHFHGPVSIVHNHYYGGSLDTGPRNAPEDPRHERD